MGIRRKSIKSDGKKINKSNFYKNKKLFKIDVIDVNKILISKKEEYGTNKSIKYFIGYNDGDDDDIIRPLCIKLSQMIEYAKHFEYNNKTVSFKVVGKKLLERYTQIWERAINFMNLNFDSEPVYVGNDKNT